VSSVSFVGVATLLILTDAALLGTHLFLAWMTWQSPPKGGVRMRLALLTLGTLTAWLLLAYACDLALGEGIGPFHGEAIARRLLELTFLLPFYLPNLLFGYPPSTPLGILLLLGGLLLLALLPVFVQRGIGSLAAWLTFLAVAYGTFLFGGTALGDPAWPDWLWPLLAGIGGGLIAGGIAHWRRGSAYWARWAVCGAAVGAGGAAIGGGLGLGVGWPFVYQADIPGMLLMLAVVLLAGLFSLGFVALCILESPPRSQLEAAQ
jgi:hypothetical protein